MGDTIYVGACITRELHTMIFAESGKMQPEIQRGNGRLERDICPSDFHNMEKNRFDTMQTDGLNTHPKHNSRTVS